MSFLERQTGQTGLWWVWHLSATVLLVLILLSLQVSISLQRQQVQLQTEQLQVQRDLAEALGFIKADSTNASFYARHAACASLFLVGATFRPGDPWELFREVTEQSEEICQTP